MLFVPDKVLLFVRDKVHESGPAFVASTSAFSLGSSGKYDAFEFPTCVIVTVAGFDTVTEIDIDAPFLKMINPRPPRRITILSMYSSPSQVPAIMSVETCCMPADSLFAYDACVSVDGASGELRLSKSAEIVCFASVIIL